MGWRDGGGTHGFWIRRRMGQFETVESKKGRKKGDVLIIGSPVYPVLQDRSTLLRLFCCFLATFLPHGQTLNNNNKKKTPYALEPDEFLPGKVGRLFFVPSPIRRLSSLVPPTLNGQLSLACES